MNVLGQERFKEIVLENTEPLKTERYPGYKRGSKSFNDECGVPGAGTKGQIIWDSSAVQQWWLGGADEDQ